MILEGIMIKALTLEWEMVRKWIIRSVLNGPRHGDSNRIMKMRSKRMRMGIRSWHTIYIPHLLSVVFDTVWRCI